MFYYMLANTARRHALTDKYKHMPVIHTYKLHRRLYNQNSLRSTPAVASATDITLKIIQTAGKTRLH